MNIAMQFLGILIIAAFLLGVRWQQKRMTNYRGDARKALRDENGELTSMGEQLTALEYWQRIALFVFTVIVLGAIAAGVAAAMHNHGLRS